jgi:hypothetical protein
MQCDTVHDIYTRRFVQHGPSSPASRAPRGVQVGFKFYAEKGATVVKSPSDSLTPYFNGRPVLAK